MKFKRALKIILLTVCVFLTGGEIVVMYFVLLSMKESFNYRMFIPLFMISLGVLSIVYHFKTLRLYNSITKIIVFKDEVLWFGNILFALSQISASLYLIYKISIDNQATDKFIVFAICFVMLVLGLCLIIEAHNLYKRILISNKDLYKRTIDDIKGLDENLD